MSERKLASIQKIVSLTTIPDADKIETARVLNWDVVVKKGQFKVGDLVVYIEIDSFVPNSLAPFLTKEGKDPREYEGIKGERLRTVRLKKQLSQGLILPIPDTLQKVKEDKDVSEELGIIKYDVENQEEKVPAKQSKIFKILMKHKWFRVTIGNRILKWKTGLTGGFPSHLIPKSDETRIQGLVREFPAWKGTSGWSVSEKLDGQSATYYIEVKTNFLFFKKYLFGVCSRNMRIKKPDNGNHWTIAKKLDIDKKLIKASRNLKINFAIQGEIIGGKIQGNKYKRSELEFYIFTIRNLNDGSYFNNKQIEDFCALNGFNHVPYLEHNFTIPLSIDAIVAIADGESAIEKGVLREGIVIRNNENPRISFKAISNKFLLKNDKD
jgi:hypothetical protein